MIRTKIKLAQKLDIARSTLDRYLALPGAPIAGPDGWDELAVARWISDHADSERTLSRYAPEIRKLKARELKLRCDRLAFKLETERQKWIPITIILPAIRNAYSHQKILLQQILETQLPPKLVALDQIEIRQHMAAAVDQILAIQRNELNRWMQDPPSTEAPLPENP